MIDESFDSSHFKELYQYLPKKMITNYNILCKDYVSNKSNNVTFYVNSLIKMRYQNLFFINDNTKTTYFKFLKLSVKLIMYSSF